MFANLLTKIKDYEDSLKSAFDAADETNSIQKLKDLNYQSALLLNELILLQCVIREQI